MMAGTAARAWEHSWPECAPGGQLCLDKEELREGRGCVHAAQSWVSATHPTSSSCRGHVGQAWPSWRHRAGQGTGWTRGPLHSRDQVSSAFRGGWNPASPLAPTTSVSLS